MKIAAITVNRSDFGRMSPIYKKLQNYTNIQLQLFVSGNHFQDLYGHTVDESSKLWDQDYKGTFHQGLP